MNAGPSSSADEASWKTFARLLAGRDLSGVVLAEKLAVFFLVKLYRLRSTDDQGNSPAAENDIFSS